MEILKNYRKQTVLRSMKLQEILYQTIMHILDMQKGFRTPTNKYGHPQQ